MWKTKELDKGKCPDNKKIEFEFEYEGAATIKSASGTCGCTKVTIDGNKIIGTIEPKPVSEVVPSIVAKKEYNTEQTVSVALSDTTMDFLKIKATVIEG